MRRKIQFFTAFLFIALLASNAFAASPRPRLAVREFENKAGGSVPAAAITEMMTTELFKARLFNLVEREKLNYIAEEVKLGQSGLVDESTAPELGKIKGAQYSMTGAVTLYYYNSSGGIVYLPGVGGGLLARTAYVTLDIRIIDNTTSEVVYAAAEQGVSNQNIGGIITPIAAFGAGKTGGMLAAATRDAVIKHAEAMKTVPWEMYYFGSKNNE